MGCMKKAPVGILAWSVVKPCTGPAQHNTTLLGVFRYRRNKCATWEGENLGENSTK